MGYVDKVGLYRDFLWKVNYSNGLLVEAQDKQYKMFLGKGNNSLLIKGLMKRRFWWTIVDKVTDDVNFVWTQLKVPGYFEHQEPHQSSRKATMLARSTSSSNHTPDNSES